MVFRPCFSPALSRLFVTRLLFFHSVCGYIIILYSENNLVALMCSLVVVQCKFIPIQVTHWTPPPDIGSSGCSDSLLFLTFASPCDQRPPSSHRSRRRATTADHRTSTHPPVYGAWSPSCSQDLLRHQHWTNAKGQSIDRENCVQWKVKNTIAQA